MPPKRDRGSFAKHWCLTVFNDAEKEWFKKVEAQCKYWSYQEEVCPETGKEHIQAYLGFEEKLRFGAIKDMFPTAHIEVALNAPASYDYCRKEASRKPGGVSGSSGERPCHKADGSVVGGAKRNQSELAKEFFEAGGELADGKRRFFKLYCDNPGGLLRLFELFSPIVKPPEPNFQPDVVILYGPPGTGKTSTAKLMFGERKYFRLTIGKWADGYEYESGILFDDMEPNLVPRAQLLVLMETGYCRWEVKGGVILLNVQQVIITSNFDPLEWFPRAADGKDREKMHTRGLAVVRRAKVFECSMEGVVARSGGNTSTPDLDLVKKNQRSLLDLWKPAASSSSAP